MSTFLLNVPPNRNFGDTIAVQDLRVEFMYEILSEVPPNQNPGAANACISRKVLIRVQSTTLRIQNDALVSDNRHETNSVAYSTGNISPLRVLSLLKFLPLYVHV